MYREWGSSKPGLVNPPILIIMGDFYKTTIERWKKLYKVEQRPYNPAEVRTYCSICESIDQVQRHHKACDFTFGVILPEVYAQRYLEFRVEDIDFICGKCHEAFNKYIRDHRNRVIGWSDWARVHVREGYREELEDQRLHLLKKYESWKRRRIKNIKRRKK